MQDVIPFKIPDTLGGLLETDGLLRLEDDTLVLEVHSRILGKVSAGLRSFRLGFDRLEEIRFERGLFRRRLRLRLRSMEGLGGLPGLKTGELDLRVAREDADRAESLATAAALRLTGQRIAELDARLKDES